MPTSITCEDLFNGFGETGRLYSIDRTDRSGGPFYAFKNAGQMAVAIGFDLATGKQRDKSWWWLHPTSEVLLYDGRDFTWDERRGVFTIIAHTKEAPKIDTTKPSCFKEGIYRSSRGLYFAWEGILYNLEHSDSTVFRRIGKKITQTFAGGELLRSNRKYNATFSELKAPPKFITLL